MKNTDTLTVFFEDSVAGGDEIKFAHGLARRLGPMSVDVFLPARAASSKLATATLGLGCELVEYERVKNLLARLVNYSEPDFRITRYEGNKLPALVDGTLLVTSSRCETSGQKNCIFTASEASIDDRGKGEICIPIGDGKSGIYATNAALPLIKRLGVSIVFYHTTWTKPEVTSTKATDHISEAAEHTLREARRLADAYAIKSRAIIETADGVAEGIVRCALREQCSLIVMAQGQAIRKGSYSAQTKSRSPIPMIIFANEAF